MAKKDKCCNNPKLIIIVLDAFDVWERTALYCCNCKTTIEEN